MYIWMTVNTGELFLWVEVGYRGLAERRACFTFKEAEKKTVLPERTVDVVSLDPNWVPEW